jgi:hypothetical protein
MSDQYHYVHKTVIIVWYNWLSPSEMVFIKLSKKKKKKKINLLYYLSQL